MDLKAKENPMNTSFAVHTNCTSFYSGLRHTKEPIFFATNIVMVPILFIIGLIGNIFTLVVVNRRDMRKQTSVYVYLTALAVSDSCILSLVFPLSLRDGDFLPASVVYSRGMATYNIIQYGITNIFKHAATWIMVTVAIVRHFGISKPLSTKRWTQIRTSRITVCIIFICCVILDVPRFYELDVYLIPNTCYDVDVWVWTHSRFGLTDGYLHIYPSVVVVLCFILPFLCILIFNALLLYHISLSRFKGRGVLRHNRHKRKEVQTTVMLMTVIMVFFVLELPESIANMCLAIGGAQLITQSKRFSEFLLCANCLSLVHCSINFVFYSMMSSEFRKGFRLTFCRLCCSIRQTYIGSQIASSRTRSGRKSSLYVGTPSVGSDPATRIQNERRCVLINECDL